MILFFTKERMFIMCQSHTDDLSESLKLVLYDKNYTCPICENTFKAKSIRVGKNQLLEVDDDLYAHYAIINPLLYDVITCPNCNYSAIVKNFEKLLPRQQKWLQTNLVSVFTHPTAFGEYTTTEEAIHKHKLALLMAINKKSKIGEQSYLALHIAWLYRDLGDDVNEKAFLQKAFAGFSETLETETTPILGLDEYTIMYMLAAIAFKLGDTESSKKFLSILLTTSGLSSRIKDRALDLKDKLRNS